MKRIQSHAELVLLLLKSQVKLIDEIKTKNAYLKKIKDYDEVTQLHYTTRIIQNWFRTNGMMPV